MANKEISGLTAATALTGTEKIHTDQAGNSRWTTVSAILTYVLGVVSVWTKPQRKNVVSVTPTATVFAPDWNLANDYDLGTLTANSTLDGGSNGPAANSAQAGEITVDLAGFTFGINATDWDFPDALEPAMSGKVTFYYRLWHDGTTLHKRITGVKAWG